MGRRELELVFVSDEYSVTSAVQEQSSVVLADVQAKFNNAIYTAFILLYTHTGSKV